MKVPEKVVFSFDPDTSDIEALQTFEGRVMWACIKTQHITSQYFNGNVLAVATVIRNTPRMTYRKFMRFVRAYLGEFGTRMVKSENFGIEMYRTMDDEYWRGLWRYIKHRKVLNMQSPTSPSKPKEPSGS